jgi:glycosyltransferase involved in cell wall biosynthesis
VKVSVVEEYHLNPDSIPVIINGIDLSKCKPKENNDVHGNFKILHIGRFSEQKNHMGLLSAFRSFHDNHPDSELWLIGDGELRLAAEEFVRENNLSQAVQFLGLQSNVHSFLHDADVFALPSNYEGIPMTLIEAMGTGLPVVATRVGGIPDMLDDNSALLVPVDVNAVADAFEQYYCDEGLRKKHGLTAGEYAVRFSARVMAENYLKVYAL